MRKWFSKNVLSAEEAEVLIESIMLIGSLVFGSGLVSILFGGM